MNPSLTKSTPETPASPPAPTLQSLQRENSELRQQYRAVSQYLWLLVENSHGASMDVKLDTSRIDPLWSILFLQVNDAKGEPDPNKIHILAATLPPLEESHRKRLVRKLRGTAIKLQDVLGEFELGEYPPHYVERFLSERIVWNKDKNAWDSVTPPNFGEKVKNLLHFPS